MDASFFFDDDTAANSERQPNDSEFYFSDKPQMPFTIEDMLRDVQVPTKIMPDGIQWRSTAFAKLASAQRSVVAAAREKVVQSQGAVANAWNLIPRRQQLHNGYTAIPRPPAPL
jgi:hypothetical protein